LFVTILLLLGNPIDQRYVLAGACIAEAAVVAVAIAFVALDSASVVWTGCGFMGPAHNEATDMSWLYYSWGLAIAVLLYQAVRVARYTPREPEEPEGEPDVSGPPID
jgi:hypothetical protein